MVIFAANLVSSTRELSEFLGTIPPRCTLYLDLAGDNVSRQGKISLITVLIHQLQQIHIIDVLSLGNVAFTTTSDSGASLKSILEDSSTTKWFWDIRNNADALWAHYEIDLAGVLDIQLLENASRLAGHDKELLCERDNAIRADLAHRVGLAQDTQRRRPETAWMPLQGREDKGSPVMIRPLAKDSMISCTRGVLHLRGLRDVYMRRISIAWLAKVRQESVRRVLDARSQEYEPQSPTQTKGPWKARIGTVGMAPAVVDGKDSESSNSRFELEVMESAPKETTRLSRFSSFGRKNVAGFQHAVQPSVQNATDDWWD